LLSGTEIMTIFFTILIVLIILGFFGAAVMAGLMIFANVIGYIIAIPYVILRGKGQQED
jgi:hypothetical protein